MAEGMFSGLKFPAVFFWVSNPLKDPDGSPLWVYTYMNPYEKFVSIHNVTDSTDLRGLMFPVPIFCVGLCLMVLGFEVFSSQACSEGGVTVYLLGYLWYLVSHGTNALASGMGQN